jgi:hypothetical protein
MREAQSQKLAERRLSFVACAVVAAQGSFVVSVSNRLSHREYLPVALSYSKTHLSLDTDSQGVEVLPVHLSNWALRHTRRQSGDEGFR